MRTIVVADAVMGLDNVLGVAGAAQGNYLLVVLGLVISVPIVVWGSRLLLRVVERYPVIIYFGAAVLAWTAVKMITSEPAMASHRGSEPCGAAAVVSYGDRRRAVGRLRQESSAAGIPNQGAACRTRPDEQALSAAFLIPLPEMRCTESWFRLTARPTTTTRSARSRASSCRIRRSRSTCSTCARRCPATWRSSSGAKSGRTSIARKARRRCSGLAKCWNGAASPTAPTS